MVAKNAPQDESRKNCNMETLHYQESLILQVLSNEVGDGVTVQSLLNSPSGWRGRAQQILALQKKVQFENCQIWLLNF